MTSATLLSKKEPHLFVNNFESYFKQTPPDCSLNSEGNFEIRIHKEVLFQTSALCEMIITLNVESKIEIICPFLNLKELEMIVKFLYKGEVSHFDQSVIYQASKSLVELFGFPLLDKEANVDYDIKESIPKLDQELIPKK